MNKLFLGIFLLCLVQTLFGQDKSITDSGVRAGKWLITISVGDMVSKEATLKLRNLTKEILAKPKGGLYKHAIDLDDKIMEQGKPTKEKILQELNRLREEVRLFKEQNPGSPTMIFWAWLGHGLTDKNGTYTMAVYDDNFNGAEIVQIIKDLEVDETILLLNSCQSGSLVNNHFDSSIGRMLEEIKKIAVRSQVRLSVITPVPQEINSRVFVWEEVLSNAFYFVDADVNGDDIVTYGEWKNDVIRRSCLNEMYLPATEFTHGHFAKPIKTGLEPQFFDQKMPADLPLYLTEDGVKKLQSGGIVIPPYTQGPTVIRPDVKKICDIEREFVHRLHNMQSSELIKIYKSAEAGVVNKWRVLAHLAKREYVFSDELMGFLVDEITSGANSRFRQQAIFLLGEKGPEEGTSPKLDKVITDLIKKYSTFDYSGRFRILEMLAKLRAKSAFSLMAKIAKEEKDIDLRYEAVRGLGRIRDQRAVQILMDKYQEEVGKAFRIMIIRSLAELKNSASFNFYLAVVEKELEADLRYEAVAGLGELKDKRAVPHLIKYLENDQQTMVRVYSAFYLGRMKASDSYKSLVKAVTTDTAENVRAFAATALGNLGMKEAIGILEKVKSSDSSALVKQNAGRAIALLSGL